MLEIVTEKKKGVRLKKSFCLKAKTFQKRLDNKDNVWYYNYRKRKERKKMKIKLKMDCGYVGTDYEEEMEVDDDITEKELEKLEIEFFWENFSGSYSYEIIEE